MRESTFVKGEILFSSWATRRSSLVNKKMGRKPFGNMVVVFHLHFETNKIMLMWLAELGVSYTWSYFKTDIRSPSCHIWTFRKRILIASLWNRSQTAMDSVWPFLTANFDITEHKTLNCDRFDWSGIWSRP